MTVGVVAVESRSLAARDIGYADVVASDWILLRPLWYGLIATIITISVFLHDGWDHFVGKVRLLVPFGVVLTSLTSNRHVAVVVFVPHALSEVLYVVTAGRPSIGASGAVFAFVAVTLVRATSSALENASTESLANVLALVLVPVMGALFALVLLFAGDRVAHFAQFTSFLFGAAIEATYVLSDREEQKDRTLPDRLTAR